MQSFSPIFGSTVSISASTSSTPQALSMQPSAGTFQLRIYNAGPATAFINIDGSSVTATTSNYPIPSGAIEVITISNPAGRPATTVAAITASSTATVYFTVGWGI